LREIGVPASGHPQDCSAFVLLRPTTQWEMTCVAERR
jgi:hypothetical protein